MQLATGRLHGGSRWAHLRDDYMGRWRRRGVVPRRLLHNGRQCSGESHCKVERDGLVTADRPLGSRHQRCHNHSPGVGRRCRRGIVCGGRLRDCRWSCSESHCEVERDGMVSFGRVLGHWRGLEHRDGPRRLGRRRRRGIVCRGQLRKRRGYHGEPHRKVGWGGVVRAKWTMGSRSRWQCGSARGVGRRCRRGALCRRPFRDRGRDHRESDCEMGWILVVRAERALGRRS